MTDAEVHPQFHLLFKPCWCMLHLPTWKSFSLASHYLPHPIRTWKLSQVRSTAVVEIGISAELSTNHNFS